MYLSGNDGKGTGTIISITFNQKKDYTVIHRSDREDNDPIPPWVSQSLQPLSWTIRPCGPSRPLRRTGELLPAPRRRRSPSIRLTLSSTTRRSYAEIITRRQDVCTATSVPSRTERKTLLTKQGRQHEITRQFTVPATTATTSGASTGQSVLTSIELTKLICNGLAYLECIAVVRVN
jgi:hypothetical protein